MSATAVLTVVEALSLLTDLALSGMEIGIQLQKVSSIVFKVQSEGRTTLTDAESATLELAKNTAFDRFQKAIDAAGTTA